MIITLKNPKVLTYQIKEFRKWDWIKMMDFKKLPKIEIIGKNRPLVPRGRRFSPHSPCWVGKEFGSHEVFPHRKGNAHCQRSVLVFGSRHPSASSAGLWTWSWRRLLHHPKSKQFYLAFHLQVQLLSWSCIAGSWGLLALVFGHSLIKNIILSANDLQLIEEVKETSYFDK